MERRWMKEERSEWCDRERRERRRVRTREGAD